MISPSPLPCGVFCITPRGKPSPRGERVGHSSPQQRGVFWNILINKMVYADIKAHICDKSIRTLQQPLLRIESPYLKKQIVQIFYWGLFYFGREQQWYYLLSFVIMPDHMHLIIIPRGKNISECMKSIKGFSARKVKYPPAELGGILEYFDKTGIENPVYPA